MSELDKNIALFELAERKMLPDHQFMDIETLDWIRGNCPFETPISIRGSDINECIDVVHDFAPEEEWFLKKRGVDTIHGIRHIVRVMCLTRILAKQKGLSQKMTDNVLIAAAVHDLRRENDKGDEGHAKRAAEWLKDNKEVVGGHFGITISEEDMDMVSQVILMHEAPYSEICESRDYAKYKRPVDVLKTADALDRYRQPRMKWWINDDYLQLIPGESTKMFAFDLMVRSEDKALKGESGRDSVVKALTEMKEQYE